jgi:hypothetical protein
MRRRQARRAAKVVPVLVGSLIAVALTTWAAWLLYKSLGRSVPSVPLAEARRGDVTFTVTARGQLQGGNPEVVTAPMSGGELGIKYLRKPGELVRAGDVVVEFDTADQEFQLKEAESDVGEAEQQVTKARADQEAQKEENHFQLLQAQGDVHQAEFEVRKNPLQSAISAQQNDLALQIARDRLTEVEHDLANRAASGQAAVAIQEAARGKAQMQAAIARRNIELMTVRARTEGYVSIRQNSTGSSFLSGMAPPLYRAGDRLNAGMPVADILDLKDWELSVAIDELDRGHLAPGQKVDIRLIALPFRSFHGKFKHMGGTLTSRSENRFECIMSIDDPTPELRPGMSAEVVITTDVVKNVLWVPAQAVFESGDRTFVYVPSGSGFAPRDVTLLRKSDTQAIVAGLPDKEVVALSGTEQQPKKVARPTGALQALPR